MKNTKESKKSLQFWKAYIENEVQRLDDNFKKIDTTNEFNGVTTDEYKNYLKK